MTRIYILCPDWPEPSGGVKKLYRHAEVLGYHRIAATIVHQKRDFRPNWFQSSATVSYEDQIKPGASDFMLVPEVAASQVFKMARWRGLPKLIINQGAYQTFTGYSFVPNELESPYVDADFKGAIVVSDDSKRYLEFAFPTIKVIRIHNSVDPRLFYPTGTKKRQIAFMPRRNGKDALQVINMLKFRGTLDGFDLAVIYKLPEGESARVLRESIIFLSLGKAEGSPLPPAEAMACGCLVIGYDGRGGREFITPEYAFPVEAGDIVSFASTLESVIRQLRGDPEPLRQKAQRASEFILGTYTPQREEADILAAWGELAGVTPQAP